MLRRHHERLASVLTESGPADPEVLAGHYRGAGDASTASEYSARGADLAASALAFDHAARLYRTAIELDPGPPERSAILRRKLGDALANAGRCDEAARAYLDAAATSSPGDALEWKRLASTQLLIGGDVDAGLGLLRELLAPLGIAMPQTPRAAPASLLWNRALLKIRGLEFRERPPEQVPAADLRRIDLCWSAVAGLSMFEPIRGADFQVRGLRIALKAGEPFRMARALAMEAAHRATEGVPASRCVARLLDDAAGLADRLGSPHASGMVELARGLSALLFGRWPDAFEALERAEALFRDHCTGVAWERDTGQNFALWALYQMGRIADLRRRRSLLDREARARGDRYATRALGTFYATLIRLAADDPPGPESSSGMVAAARGGGRLNLQQTPAFDSLMHIDLYRGEVHSARARLDAIWPEYERSMLFRVQLIRIQLLELRARTAIATAERSRNPDPLLDVAEADAFTLEREGQGWAIAHATYLLRRDRGVSRGGHRRRARPSGRGRPL